MRKIVLLAVVALCLAPGTWLRSAAPKFVESQKITMTALDLPRIKLGETILAGAWRLDSPHSAFGSYSALLALDDHQFLAASDTGWQLDFPVPGVEGATRIGRFAGRSARRKNLIDIESLTRDPAMGRIWVGFEGTNTIERLESDLTRGVKVRPAAMAKWRGNAGPEAMARLGDGRFVVMSEGPRRWFGNHFPGLLFAGDPAAGAKSVEFAFVSPDGFAPVDMAQLPDGRVMILVRNFSLGLPPRFTVKLLVADPGDIAAGKDWTGREIALIDDKSIQDNYEGLAIVPRDDGTLDLWLISDDNNTTFQRTLLLKLLWDPAQVPSHIKKMRDTEKARENSARPSKNSN